MKETTEPSLFEVLHTGESVIETDYGAILFLNGDLCHLDFQIPEKWDRDGPISYSCRRIGLPESVSKYLELQMHAGAYSGGSTTCDGAAQIRWLKMVRAALNPDQDTTQPGKTRPQSHVRKVPVL